MSSPDYTAMKPHYLTLCRTALFGVVLTTANFTFAQTAVKEVTTTTSAGTISEFGPDTIIVRSETSTEPTRYSYSKTTTYVDESGAPVSMETVKSGLPVTVYYVKTGDQMVASKVIVRKAAVQAAPATVETRTTTSAGTITEFGPESIIVRSQGTAAPIRYSYNKTTTYVDEAGTPVSIETVKSGIPVTVHYVKSGDQMVASKVIVRKVVLQPAPAIEEKKTTTTTTTTEK